MAGTVSERHSAHSPAEPLYELLAGRARQSPDRVAIEAPRRRPLTYGQLARRLQDLRAWLGAAGVNPDDRVALVLPQGPELAVGVLGVAASAGCAPLNPAYQAAEYERHLRELRPKAVLVQAGSDSPARAVAHALGIPLLEIHVDAEAPAGLFALPGAAGSAAPAAAGLDSVALLLPTSGTTSRPKLVPLSHANLHASAHSLAATLALGAADRCLDVMPLYHIHGLMVLVASLAAGASVVCSPPLDARRFFSWLDEHRPTWYTAVPTMHQAILAEAEHHRDTIARAPLRFVRSCSAALPSGVAAELERVFAVPVINAYGMTEAAHQVATNLLPPAMRKAGSVGRPAGVELSIVDLTGRPLPAGSSGEVVIRGRSVMAGYADNPEANSVAFYDGWLRTGDEGHLDAEGYLFLTGRLKEIINRGGEKVAPAEVDEVLLAHPRVAQAVTFAVPHSTLGEDVAAVIVTHPGAAVTEDALRAFAGERLAPFKVPRQVLFRAGIPQGPSGKLQRLGLAVMLGLVAGDGSPLRAGARMAPRTPAEASLATIWAGVLGLEEVGIDQNFFALGGDSLRAVRLVNEIARTFGRQLPPATLLQTPTVEALARLVAAAAPAAWTALIPLQPKGARPPLYCVHQHTGQIFCYRDLARHLGDERPIYGLVPRGLDGDHIAWNRIEAMAAHYVGEIRAVQPEGPYHVLGFCFGGIVAFEMAQQLSAQGQRVGLLALVQASWHGRLRAPHRWLRSLSRRLRFEWHQLARQPSGQRPSYVARRGAGLAREGWRVIRAPSARPGPDLAGSPSSVEQAIRRVETANEQALAHYEPRTYPSPITLFRSHRIPASFHGDPTLGWAGLAAGGVQIHEIQGDRPNVVDEPDVRILAAELRACLDAAGRPGDPGAGPPPARAPN